MPKTNFPGGITVENGASVPRTVAGEVTLDGSNPTPVATGLTTIDSAVVCLEGSTAPGADPTQVSCAISGGTLNIYAWKPSAAGATDLIASTNSTRKVKYIAVGS